MDSVDALGIIPNPVNAATAEVDIIFAVLFIFETAFVIPKPLSVLLTIYKSGWRLQDSSRYLTGHNVKQSW